MPSRISQGRADIRERHYLRNATSQNHWFDFTASGIGTYRSRFGDNFCLIVNGSHTFDDAFIIPYAVAKDIFTTSALDRRGRWIGTIVDNILRLGTGKERLDVARYHNAFNLLDRNALDEAPSEQSAPKPSTAQMRHIVLRKLTGSELGWFAAARRLGRAKGRQRGININAPVMQEIFPEPLLETGAISVRSRRFSDGQTQDRSIRLQEKNWRLVGDKVEGRGLEAVAEGDFFWGALDFDGTLPCSLLWDVVTASLQPDLHLRLIREFSVHLDGGMAFWADDDLIGDHVATVLGLHAVSGPSNSADGVHSPTRRREAPRPLPSKPIPEVERPTRRRRRIDDRLRRPHILAEILKSGMALSAGNQADYIDVLDSVSAELRNLFSEAKFIVATEISQNKLWPRFHGKQIGFVDGGMANVSALGAAPLALRVGSYLVTPGESGVSREQFDFEVQLVDELYEPSGHSGGVYEDSFDDVAKLRDAARMCCETAGVITLSDRTPRPHLVLLHGPLVNPVSPYALGVPGTPDAFPNFTEKTLRKLLPPGGPSRTGRDANFVAVYRDQLHHLSSGSVTVCGVVERASPTAPGPVVRLLTEKLKADAAIDQATAARFEEIFRKYRLTDSVILECVLEEGESLVPVEMDKQGPDHKIPAAWAVEIKSYVRPLVTYVKPSAETMPIRVESFPTGAVTHVDLIALVIHMSRLLPRYAFPVGLDIVDKHAKVPEWMSRQMNVMLQAQLMRRAMDTENPNMIRMVRRILASNTRDWLFRPDFRKG